MYDASCMDAFESQAHLNKEPPNFPFWNVELLALSKKVLTKITFVAVLHNDWEFTLLNEGIDILHNVRVRDKLEQFHLLLTISEPVVIF